MTDVIQKATAVEAVRILSKKPAGSTLLLEGYEYFKNSDGTWTSAALDQDIEPWELALHRREVRFPS